MSAVHDPTVQCHGKVAYPTKRDAKRRIHHHPNRKRLHAYRCPHCRDFHLGHRHEGTFPTSQQDAA